MSVNHCNVDCLTIDEFNASCMVDCDDIAIGCPIRFGNMSAKRKMRDANSGEDHCRLWTGAAPQVLAGVRNLVMN